VSGELLNGDQFFDRWHDAGAAAFEILLEGFPLAPPSLEVFEHGLETARDRAKAPIDVRRYARTLADSYQGGTAP